MMNISKHLLENLVQVSVFPKAFSVENISQILVLDDKLVSETVTVKTSMMGCSLLQSTGNEMYNLHPLVRQYCRTEKNVLEMEPDIGKSAQDKFNRHYNEKPKILSALFKDSSMGAISSSKNATKTQCMYDSRNCLEVESSADEKAVAVHVTNSN